MHFSVLLQIGKMLNLHWGSFIPFPEATANSEMNWIRSRHFTNLSEFRVLLSRWSSLDLKCTRTASQPRRIVNDLAAVYLQTAMQR